jgi:hypothetical protein
MLADIHHICLNNMKKYVYLEIVEYGTDEVVKRMDVTNKSERLIERIERGVNINLNHNEFFTRQSSTEENLKEI